MNSTITRQEQQERDADKCRACGAHGVEERRWCAEHEEWVDDCVACLMIPAGACEGYKLYLYCPACGHREEI